MSVRYTYTDLLLQTQTANRSGSTLWSEYFIVTKFQLPTDKLNESGSNFNLYKVSLSQGTQTRSLTAVGAASTSKTSTLNSLKQHSRDLTPLTKRTLPNYKSRVVKSPLKQELIAAREGDVSHNQKASSLSLSLANGHSSLQQLITGVIKQAGILMSRCWNIKSIIACVYAQDSRLPVYTSAMQTCTQDQQV